MYNACVQRARYKIWQTFKFPEEPHIKLAQGIEKKKEDKVTVISERQPKRKTEKTTDGWQTRPKEIGIYSFCRTRLGTVKYEGH